MWSSLYDEVLTENCTSYEWFKREWVRISTENYTGVSRHNAQQSVVSCVEKGVELQLVFICDRNL